MNPQERRSKGPLEPIKPHRIISSYSLPFKGKDEATFALPVTNRKLPEAEKGSKPKLTRLPYAHTILLTLVRTPRSNRYAVSTFNSAYTPSPFLNKAFMDQKSKAFDDGRKN
jgi:hypothetical protein